MLDGAYLVGTHPPVFRRIAPPSVPELQSLLERLAKRIGRALEREGVLSRDAESSYLELGAETRRGMEDLLGHSIAYRVAVGPRAGQKVFALQSVPARAEEPRNGVAQYAGFSLHAGIGVEAEQRDKLERLARYVSRPPVAVERLDLTAQGQVRYHLKTPYRDGTTHIVLEPRLDACWLRRPADDGQRRAPCRQGVTGEAYYSFSTDPQLRGAPEGHVFNVRDVYLTAGAGFMVVLSGEIMTMPGLPKFRRRTTSTSTRTGTSSGWPNARFNERRGALAAERCGLFAHEA
jgi:hypothetical protein